MCVISPAAFSLSSVFLLLCAYYGTSATIAIILLTLGVGCGGLSLAGFNINHLDIAPRYAGVLMALTNTAGTLPGIVGPLVAKAIALPVSLCEFWLNALITVHVFF